MDSKNQDIRWKQRFQNYKNALQRLQKFINKGSLSELEEQGLIKAFEYTYELAWLTLKDFLNFQGYIDIYGSRDILRKAYELGLIQNGQNWMDMLESKKKTSYTYNEETAAEISQAIMEVYFDLFQQLQEKFDSLDSTY